MKPLENLAISQISSLQIKSLLYKCQLSQYTKVVCLVAQSCLTLCDPMDCSSPGSSVHGDSPGKNTGMAAMLSFRRSFQPRDWTQVSCIAGRFFTIWAISEALRQPYRDALWGLGPSVTTPCLLPTVPTLVLTSWAGPPDGAFPWLRQHLAGGCLLPPGPARPASRMRVSRPQAEPQVFPLCVQGLQLPQGLSSHSSEGGRGRQTDGWGQLTVSVPQIKCRVWGV